MLRKSKKAMLNLALVSILVISIFVLPLSLIVTQASASTATTVLTPKWNRTSLGTNWESGMVIGDVTGDGQEDIVYCGGSQDTLYVLDGDTGETIASYQNSRIGTYCQPQIYDVDGDGVLDILCVLYYEPGLAALKYNGSSTLQELWEIYTQADQAPGGSVGSGSVMAKPVAGDIDGDGHLDIFLASQDVSPLGGYDGTIVRIDYQGNILATTFTWRACSGGLSLGDTDNDGVFELYQGDRDMDYSDGGYGKGVKSYWAANLTERWTRLDDLTSSQAPILADVNGDGIKDVITGMYNVMWVLNSTNGESISHWSSGDLSVHYGTTVYDIDGDGHLELLCSDGDHDDQSYVDVLDLVTGQMDAELSLAGGDWKWGPLVADIDPTNPGMEIIACPNGTSVDNPNGNYWYGSIMIYGDDYESIQNVTRTTGNGHLGSQLGFPVVQDIDGDGLLELLVCSSYPGNVYAFDTLAAAPGWTGNVADGLTETERLRSEVTYYGEDRLGVAQHTIMPGEDNYWAAPIVAPVYPADNALAVPITTDQLTFKLREYQSEALNYSVTTSPNIGSINGSISSGTYNWNNITIPVSGLAYDTTYTWTVNASDGSEITKTTYTFRTQLAPNAGNSPPTQDNPTLVSLNGLDTTTSTFQCSNQSTADINRDAITNIYNWKVNGELVTKLLLPFNTRHETSTTDFSGFGNDGEVIGASWVSDGIVGGAYHFDGKDDAIVISDGGAGFFNDVDYADNNEELGGFGDWNAVTVEAWVYLDEYTNGSTIVGKIPSYALGFTSESSRSGSNLLYGAVWPYTGVVATDENQASVDYMQTVTASVNLELDTWYHIAFSYEDGVGLKLYLNGALVGESSTSGGSLSPSRGEPLYIGRLVQPFAGMIDEVRLYAYALPEEQVNNRYLESKDGESSSSFFTPIGVAQPGDSLSCDVIPTDSYVEGITRSTIVITVNPSLPISSDLNIYPLRNSAYRLDSEDLIGNYVYTQADKISESGTQIRWYKNGALQSELNNTLKILANSTEIGETWYFTVLPMDAGGGVGELKTSPAVIIRANTAPNTDTPSLDSTNGGTAYDDEDLIGTAGTTTDADGDATTNIFHWTRDGVSQTNMQLPFDTEVPTVPGVNGITRDYSGYGNDAAVNGTRWIQDGVVGGAMDFDGSDRVQVIDTNNKLGRDGSWSEMTVEFWVKSTEDIETFYFPWILLAMHNTSFSALSFPGYFSPYGLAYNVEFSSTNGYDQIQWIIYTDSGEVAAVTNIGNARSWHHITCTYESGVGLMIYVDGTLSASVYCTGNITAVADGILDIGGTGHEGFGQYGSSTDFIGSLDEVRIYPTALSAAQIFQRYIDTKDGLSDSETIVPQETTAGESWICQIIPNDSWEDGIAVNSQSLNVNATVGNSSPKIEWYSPIDLTLDVAFGNTTEFKQVSSDPNGDLLNYTWTLDSIEQATTQNWTYTPTATGSHQVRVTVSDGSLSDFQDWTVNVLSSTMYNLTILSATNGDTNPAAGVYTYPEGNQVPIQALPNAGYKFDYWLLNGTNVGATNPYSLTMDANYNVTAVFVELPQFLLHLEVSGSGTTNATGDTLYYKGTTLDILATANTSYTFHHWIIDGFNPGSANPLQLIMDMDHNVTAIFVENPIQFKLNVEVSGSGTTNATGESLYDTGNSVWIYATADMGWTFSHWLLNGTNVGATNPYSLTMDANYNVTAVFVPEEYTLKINVVGNGLVTKNPNQGTYQYGTPVTLTVVAGAGWDFSAWSGDTQGTNLTVIVYMTADKEVTATFVAENPPVFTDGFESGSFSAWSSTTRTSGETTTIVSNPVHLGSYSAMFTSNGNGGYERAYAYRSGLSMREVYTRAYVYVDQSGIADNGDRFYFIQLMSGSNILAYAGWRQDSSGNLRWHIMIRDGTNTIGAYSTIIAAIDTWYCVELHWKADSTAGLGELYVNGELVASITSRNTANYGNATIARMGLPEIYNGASTIAYIDDATIDESYIGPLNGGEPEYVLLTIGSASDGTTNPATGVHQYEKNNVVYVSATANFGYMLSGWLFDGASVASNNPFSVTMDTNHTLTPVFVIIPLPTYYNLTISTSGSGSTNITGTNSYLEGSTITVLATANENYVFGNWLLNGTNVGSMNPYSVTMDANYELIAVFVEAPSAVFTDGFESGSFSAWSSTTRTSGETTTIVSNPVHLGSYSAMFTSNGNGGYEKAYAVKSLSSSIGEVSVEGKFMFSQNGIVESGDRLKLVELRSGSTIVAAAGLRQRTTGLSWWLETRDGTSYIESYTQVSSDLSQWFTLELQWINDASVGGGSLLINGVAVIQVSNDNTSNYGDCTEVRAGLAEVYNCGANTLYVDEVVINDNF